MPIRKHWWTYQRARRFARTLGLRNQAEWQAYAKGARPDLPPRPAQVPSGPQFVYRSAGWVGLADFLGYETFLSYPESRRLLNRLGVRTWRQFLAARAGALADELRLVPRKPHMLFGRDPQTGARLISRWLPFGRAREFARALGLATYAEWTSFCRGLRPELGSLPPGVPASPNLVYADAGWNGYSDWIGTDTARNLTGRKRRVRVIARGAWAPYSEVSRLAVERGIKSSVQWKKFAAGKLPGHGKCPENAPTNPQFVYAGDGWVSWGVFLQTGSRQPAKIAAMWLPFERAREIARPLGLSTARQWSDFVAERLVIPGVSSANLPSAPELAYAATGWVGWDDFLDSSMVPYEEAKRLVQSLGIRTMREFRSARSGQLAALLKRVPSAPDGYYAEWTTSYDFFGTPGAGRLRVCGNENGVGTAAEPTLWAEVPRAPLPSASASGEVSEGPER